MVQELYERNIVPTPTLSDIFSGKTIETPYGTTQEPAGSGSNLSGQTITNAKVIGGQMEGISYRSSRSGGRVEIFPEFDKTVGFISFAANGGETFKILVDGADQGDIYIGNYSGGQGIKWDQSAGILYVVGSITVTGDIQSSNYSGEVPYAGYKLTYETGQAVFNSIILRNSVSLSGLVAGTELAIQGWQFDAVFSSSDADTVAWGAGTLRFLDGSSYSIIGDNTGNMTAKTYIYFSKATSETNLQVTTTAANAVGVNKILIAVAENTSGSEAKFQVFGGSGGAVIAGDQIVGNTVTANKMNVSSLSAISANMGAITAGTITIDSAGYIKTSGVTDYNNGNGIWLGYHVSAYKMMIGNSADTSNLLLYDGTSMVVNDSPITQQGIFGDGSDGDVTISANTTLTSDMYYNNLTINNGVTLNPGGYRIFVKGTLTNNGTIARVGNNGTNGGNGGSYPDYGIGGTAGAGGAALAGGFLDGGEDGKNGGAGAVGVSTATGDGINGDAGVAGDSVSLSLGVNGVAGVSGGNGGTVNLKSAGTGGAGGATGTATPPTSKIRTSAELIVFRDYNSTNPTKLKGSAGSGGSGGGGSGGARGSNAASGMGGGGGGSGSGGGVILICAAKIVNNGIISVKGGNGGNGGNAGAPGGVGANNWTVGGSGGGGAGSGGPGGVLVLIYKRITAGTLVYTGGDPGTPGNKSSAVDNGGGYLPMYDGVNGTTGNTGTTGTLIQLQI